ncbi:MAG: DUF1990 domain-containing protein [Hamadaea sp.]|uniref:DUF1990 family protein n=1 Tax=Hamadaea sp. TaxID=2024425 RepID=UPI0017BEFDCE|nr:DUF1990 domain-containing protein [Hamadaea sp.]NUR72307.1 DUF1990 domain-containing protein [Hamadaea sp.]NUT18717.1 DUF1990 domain-containing protein [Hamadaea sp.]
MNLTYAEVGGSLQEELPAHYNHLRVRVPVGPPQVYANAVQAVLSWRMHSRAGLFVDAEIARPGLRVTGRLGHPRFGMPVVCEVVAVVDEPNRAGFAYGTVAGHPECGEEAFLVVVRDGQTWLEVVAFSRPAAWYARLAGPVVPLIQRAYARRLGRVLRALVAER